MPWQGEPGWLREEQELRDSLALYRACCRGDTEARTRFLGDYLDTIQEAIGRVQDDERFISEVARELVEVLFQTHEPAIQRYTRREPLRAWLRVEATRVAFSRLRAQSLPPTGAKA